MFKDGDIVYSFIHGLAKVEERQTGDEVYPLKVVNLPDRSNVTIINTYTRWGKLFVEHPNPLIITLEKAEKLGLIRKIQKPLRVKYSLCSESREMLFITDIPFRSREEFDKMGCGEFLCFVDDYLNTVCPITEWEECVR